MSTPVIVAENLTKYYGARLAVDKVSFDVCPNEVMGLPGPNGSGKSTILRILTGYLHPTSGTAQVAGCDVVGQSLEARSQLGYVPEDVPLNNKVVLAKFIASMAMLGAMIGLTGVYALVLGLSGSPDWGTIYSGYLGLMLLASMLVSIGLVVSALTSNQVIAAIITIGISFSMWMIDTLAAMVPGVLERILISFSLLARFTPFATGAMYTSNFGFFLSTTLLSLFLTMRALARR
jgi:hypothetical protein